MKRLLNTIFVALVSAAFIFLAAFFLKSQSSFYDVSKMIGKAWHLKNAEAVQSLSALIRCLVTMMPLMWIYYFSVLLPRRFGWSQACLILSLAALLIGSFVASLSVSSVYYAVFSPLCYWEVDVRRSRIPILILNLLFLAASVFFMYRNIYTPSFKKKRKHWLASDVVLRRCGRYVSLWLLGHFALYFIVSLQSFLFDARLVNLSDFVLIAKSDSRNFFGLLLLLIAEPVLHELAFRGLMFEHMESEIGPLFAGLISSLLYVAWYWKTGFELYAFLLGLLFCYVAHKGGYLRYSIFLHMIINFLRSNYFGKGDEFFFKPIAWIFASEKKWLLYSHNNGAMMLIISAISIGVLVFLFQLLPEE